MPRERSLNIGDALNCIGMNGWELVSVVADGDGKVYYFKRHYADGGTAPLRLGLVLRHGAGRVGVEVF